jgi:hypothetical protein
MYEAEQTQNGISLIQSFVNIGQFIEELIEEKADTVEIVKDTLFL